MFKQVLDQQAETVTMQLNGKSVEALKGSSVAAVALSQNLSYTRTTPVSDSKRAPFCMMGVCYECLMVINGRPNQRACSTYVEEGMQVEIQHGVGPEMGDRNG